METSTVHSRVERGGRGRVGTMMRQTRNVCVLSRCGSTATLEVVSRRPRPRTWRARRRYRAGLGRRKVRPVSADRRIANIAERQAGVVGRAQLVRVGLSRSMIARRIRKGSLFVVRRGVYAVGQLTLAPLAERWAAVLACGEGAALTGLAGAAHLDWYELPGGAPIEVAVPVGRRRRQDGLKVRRVVLHPTEVRVVDGLRCCASARILLDVAACHPGRLEQVWRGARFREMLDMEEIAAVLDRHRGERGTRRLRELWERRADLLGRADSGGEFTTLTAARRAGLPEPSLNEPYVLSSGRKPRFDLFWPEFGLVLEYDGPYHDDPEVIAEDRRRDEETRADGLRVERISYRLSPAQVDDRLAALAVEILGPRGIHSSPR